MQAADVLKIATDLQQATGNTLTFVAQIRFDSNEAVFYIGNSEKKKRRRKLQVSGHRTVVIIPSIANLST
jgi:hypothetical protein